MHVRPQRYTTVSMQISFTSISTSIFHARIDIEVSTGTVNVICNWKQCSRSPFLGESRFLVQGLKTGVTHLVQRRYQHPKENLGASIIIDSELRIREGKHTAANFAHVSESSECVFATHGDVDNPVMGKSGEGVDDGSLLSSACGACRNDPLVLFQKGDDGITWLCGNMHLCKPEDFLRQCFSNPDQFSK
jgi:hypothetical protein